MQPGWYPDPYAAAGTRWWDGATWTGHAAVPAAPLYGMLLPDPVRDLHQERRAGRWAAIGIAVQALFAILLLPAFGLLVHHASDNLTTLPDGSTSDAGPPGWFFGAFGGLELGSLIALAAQVMVIIWLDRAAKIGRNLGIPAERAQIWAILGFIVPVVNLWFPYQVARDTVPVGDPARRLVARWWGWTIAQGVISIPVFVVTVINPAVGVAVALASLLAPVTTMRYGRAMVAAISDTHHRLLGL